MLSLRSARWLLLLGCLGVNACGGGGNSQAQDDGQFEVGNTGSCFVNQDCDCGQGQIGSTMCTDDVKTCNCDDYTKFTPDTPVTFDACGGEPFGTWHLTDVDLTGFPYHLYRNNALGEVELAGACPGKLVSKSDDYDLRIELKDGGIVTFSDNTLEFTRSFLQSCVNKTLSSDSFCDEGAHGCTESNGVCSCRNSFQFSSDIGRSWERTNTTITFSTMYGSGAPLNYCVIDDQLLLEDTNAGIRFTLKKVVGGGIPAACASRTNATCTAGTGCHLGACVGDATPCAAAATEASCTNNSGCRWDTSACGGTAWDSCTLADFDVVPGCDFVSPKATCGGTAKLCSEYLAAECTNVNGCALTDNCHGENVSCATLFSDASVCYTDAGCTLSNYACTGTINCTSKTTQTNCRTVYGCEWVTDECSGTPPACSSYSVENCMNHSGCSLVDPG